MSQLFYTVKISTPASEKRLPVVWEQRLQYPSKHTFPTPIGTWFSSIIFEEILERASSERGEELSDGDLPLSLEVVGHEEFHDAGIFYMWLGTGVEDDYDFTSLGIQTIHAEIIAEALKKQGWEICPFP